MELIIKCFRGLVDVTDENFPIDSFIGSLNEYCLI